MTRPVDEIYAGEVGDALAWVFSAERLKIGADAVLEKIPKVDRVRDPSVPEGFVRFGSHPDLAGVFLYLAVLSLENLVKGIWVRDHSEINAAEVFEHIGHHRLCLLLREANLTLEPEEAELLKLARPADALGRFPVPRNADERFALDDSVSLNVLNATFQRMYERLRVDLLKGAPGDP